VRYFTPFRQCVSSGSYDSTIIFKNKNNNEKKKNQSITRERWINTNFFIIFPSGKKEAMTMVHSPLPHSNLILKKKNNNSWVYGVHYTLVTSWEASNFEVITYISLFCLFDCCFFFLSLSLLFHLDSFVRETIVYTPIEEVRTPVSEWVSEWARAHSHHRASW
jgi:hypothetical protein